MGAVRARPSLGEALHTPCLNVRALGVHGSAPAPSSLGQSSHRRFRQRVLLPCSGDGRVVEIPGDHRRQRPQDPT